MEELKPGLVLEPLDTTCEQSVIDTQIFQTGVPQALTRRVSFSTCLEKNGILKSARPVDLLQESAAESFLRSLGRRESRVSFSIPDGKTEETDDAQGAEDSGVECGRPRSESQPSLDYQNLQRRRSTVAKLVVERFVITRERRWSVGLCTVVGSMLSFLIGFTVAFPSNAILDLTGEAKELPPNYLLSTLLLSVFASLGPAGAVVGGPLSGWIADCWGRKCALMFCGVPYLTGYLLLSYAHYTTSVSVFQTVLLTGRFISGVGLGWASAVVSVYIGEISSAKLRGIFVTFNQIMFTTGIVFNYGIGSINDFPYYYISLVAVGIVALFEVLMIWLPETPRWLLSRGYGEDAEKTLVWLRGREIGIKKELDQMKNALALRKASENQVWREFSKRSVLIPFVFVLVIFFFQQAGGINAFASFASTIFSDAGVGNPRVTSIYAVGCASLAGNIASFFTVDLIGRTILLILGSAGMFLGATMLGTHFFITRPSLCDSLNSTVLQMEESMEPCNPHLGVLAIVSVIIYRISFSIGLGPVPWILLSELLPLSVRGVASGFAMVTTWTASTLVTGFYLEYAQVVQQWFAMWTFALINLAAAVFVIVFIPETKGKSLEEMERKFEKRPKVVETIL